MSGDICDGLAPEWHHGAHVNAALALLMVVFTEVPGVAPATGPQSGASVDVGSLIVEAKGDCPSGPAVTAALLPVIGNVSVPASAAPRVLDLGDRFEASAAGQTGLYVDAGRDCVERARVSAVFIALALNPPTFQSPLPRPPGPPKPVRQRWLELGAAARMDGTSAGNSPPRTALAWGGELSAAAGYGSWGGVVAAGFVDASAAYFGRFNVIIAVREQRFPLSAALRFQGQLPGRSRLGAELGAALTLARFTGDDLQMMGSTMRLEAGVRAALTVRLPPVVGHFAPFVGAYAEYFPKPYKLDVIPVGTVGSSSRLWLGATAGVLFQSL